MTEQQQNVASSPAAAGDVLPPQAAANDGAPDGAGAGAAAAGAAAAAAPPENPLLREADFSFAAAEVDQRVDQILMSKRAQVSIKGFRPGKVPLSKLRQLYGEGALNEVVRELITPKFNLHLEEKTERPAAQPHIRVSPIAQDGQYKAHCQYEVLPDVQPPALAGKTIKKPTFTVDDKAVDEMIDILRRQRGSYAVVDEAADGGDYRVAMNFKSVLLPDDKQAAGAVDSAGEAGAAEEVVDSGENRRLYLGDKHLNPQLQEALKGARAGDARSADIPFGDDAPSEKMRGRTMRITMDITAVEKLNRAELNEDFFKHFSENGKVAETPDAFRAQVETHLKGESDTRLRGFLHQRAMSLLTEVTPPFPLPQSMVFAECRRLMQEAYSGYQQRGMKEQASQLMPQMFMPDAQKRVLLGLILSAWQRREKPEITEEDREKRLQEIVSAYEDPEAAAKHIRESETEKEAVYLSVLEDRITQWVCDNCEVTEEALSVDEFFQDVGRG